MKGEFEVMCDELNISINCDEIMKAIECLHHSKSSGPYRVNIYALCSILFLWLVTFPNHGSMGVLYHYTKREH